MTFEHPRSRLEAIEFVCLGSEESLMMRFYGHLKVNFKLITCEGP